jgi:hypothetical protein
MAESQLHRFLKQTAIERLEAGGFRTYLEPDWSPLDLVSWQEYRPDIFGIREEGGLDEYAFVECETKPETNRILRKKVRLILIQSRLLRQTQRRMILTVPRHTLGTFDLRIRKFWEIWLVDIPSKKITSIERVG